uniref:KH-like RNA-binding domain-containing protein n=1 Tax=Equus asinus TaxID=9793 RepID=A0A9L0JLM9_EQUAS
MQIYSTSLVIREIQVKTTMTHQIPETEWMIEITIFGQSIVQNWVKSLLLSLASCHPEHRARVAKMEQPEEFLKALASHPGSPGVDPGRGEELGPLMK